MDEELGADAGEGHVGSRRRRSRVRGDDVTPSARRRIKREHLVGEGAVPMIRRHEPVAATEFSVDRWNVGKKEGFSLVVTVSIAVSPWWCFAVGIVIYFRPWHMFREDLILA